MAAEPPGLVPRAIAQEEALERIAQIADRRQRASADYRKRREEIDTKLAKAIRHAFELGLTATKLAKVTGLSEPRIYQLKVYNFDPDEEL